MNHTLWISLLMGLAGDAASYMHMTPGWVPWGTSVSLSSIVLTALLHRKSSTEDPTHTPKSNELEDSSSSDTPVESLSAEYPDLSENLFTAMLAELTVEENDIMNLLSFQNSLSHSIVEMERMQSTLEPVTTSTDSSNIQIVFSRVQGFSNLIRHHHSQLCSLDSSFDPNAFSLDSSIISANFQQMISHLSQKLHKLDSLENEKSSLLSSINTLEQSLAHSQTNLAELNSENIALKAKIETLKTQHSKQISEKELQISGLASSIDDITSSKDAKISSLVATNEELTTKVSNLHNEKSLLTENLSQRNLTIENLNLKIEELNTNVAELSNQSSENAKSNATIITDLKSKVRLQAKSISSIEALLKVSNLTTTRLIVQNSKLQKCVKLVCQKMDQNLHSFDNLLLKYGNLSKTANSITLANSLLFSEAAQNSIVQESMVLSYSQLLSKISNYPTVFSGTSTFINSIKSSSQKIDGAVSKLHEIPQLCDALQNKFDASEHNSSIQLSAISKELYELANKFSISQQESLINNMNLQDSLKHTISRLDQIESSSSLILTDPIPKIENSTSQFVNLCNNILIPSILSLFELIQTESDLDFKSVESLSSQADQQYKTFSLFDYFYDAQMASSDSKMSSSIKSLSKLKPLISCLVKCCIDMQQLLSDSSTLIEQHMILDSNKSESLNHLLNHISSTMIKHTQKVELRDKEITQNVNVLSKIIRHLRNSLTTLLQLKFDDNSTTENTLLHYSDSQNKFNAFRVNVADFCESFFSFFVQKTKFTQTHLNSISVFITQNNLNLNALQSFVLSKVQDFQEATNVLLTLQKRLDIFNLSFHNWYTLYDSNTNKIYSQLLSSFSSIIPNVQRKNTALDLLFNEYDQLSKESFLSITTHLNHHKDLQNTSCDIIKQQQLHFENLKTRNLSILQSITWFTNKVISLRETVSSLSSLYSNTLSEFESTTDSLYQTQKQLSNIATTLTIFSSVNTNRISATFSNFTDSKNAVIQLKDHILDLSDAFNQYYDTESAANLDFYEQKMIFAVERHVENVKQIYRQFAISYSGILTCAKTSITTLFTHIASLTETVSSLSTLVSIYCSSEMETLLLTQLSELSTKYLTLESLSKTLITYNQELFTTLTFRESQFTKIKKSLTCEIDLLLSSEAYYTKRLIDDASFRASSTKKLGTLTNLGFSSKNNIMISYITNLTHDISVLESHLVNRSKDLIGLTSEFNGTGKADETRDSLTDTLTNTNPKDDLLEFDQNEFTSQKTSETTSPNQNKVGMGMNSLDASDSSFFDLGGSEGTGSLAPSQQSHPSSSVVYKSVLPVVSVDNLLSSPTLIKSLFDSWVLIQKLEDYIKTLVSTIDSNSYIMESLIYTHYENNRTIRLLGPQNTLLRQITSFQSEQLNRLLFETDKRLANINNGWKNTFITFSTNIVNVLTSMKLRYLSSQLSTISVETVLGDLLDELDSQIAGLSLHNFSLKPLPEVPVTLGLGAGDTSDTGSGSGVQHIGTAGIKDIKIFSSISSRFQGKHRSNFKDEQFLFIPNVNQHTNIPVPGSSEFSFSNCTYTISNVHIPFNSFKDLLFYPNASKFFLNFVESQFSSENFLFWNQVQMFKLEPDTQIRFRMASDIFSQFIQQGKAELEINIPSHCRNSFMEKFNVISHQSCPNDLFDNPQDEIYDLMKRDSWPNFKKSQYFTQLIEHTRERSVSWFDSETLAHFVTKSKHTEYSDYPGAMCPLIVTDDPSGSRTGTNTTNAEELNNEKLSGEHSREGSKERFRRLSVDASIPRSNSSETLRQLNYNTSSKSPPPHHLSPSHSAVSGLSSPPRRGRSKSIDQGSRFGSLKRPVSPSNIGLTVGLDSVPISGSGSSAAGTTAPVLKKKGSTLSRFRRSSLVSGKKTNKSNK